MAGVLERGVIGVDLGGTKLLAGAVDANLAIHHRTNRLIYGSVSYTHLTLPTILRV